VNGEPVTDLEFAAFMQGVPEQQRPFYANPEGRKALADEIVRVKLLEQEARRLGLDNDDEINTRVALLRSQMAAGRALQKLVAAQIEPYIRAEFEKEKAKSFTLKHILIGYQGSAVQMRDQKHPITAEQAMKKAADIVAKLRAGADFAITARKESDDQQSALEGGSLGPARPEMLPPEVAAVVRKLEPGKISDPVRTPYGVHIFTVAAPTLEEMRPMLAQQVQQKIMAETLERLQKKAKVEKDPKFFGEESKPALPAANG